MIINALDLFCGVGGLTYGVQNAGINVVAGFDFEKSCQFAYEKIIILNSFIKILRNYRMESYWDIILKRQM